MAITHTGVDGTDWDFDQPTGIYTVGSALSTRGPDGFVFGAGGTGALLVDSASVLALVSDRADYDPHLGIGTGSSADGTVTINGAGSSVVLTGTGKTIGGANLQVGISGGSGLLELTNGGSFVINDPTLDQDVREATFHGAEGGAIGHKLGSVGEISLSGGSSFQMTGTAPSLAIGRQGGTGTIRVTDNSTFVMTNLGDQALDADLINPQPLYNLTADLRIGRGKDSGVGGNGTLDITTGGTLTLGGLTGAHKHGASLHAGREGGQGQSTS